MTNTKEYPHERIQTMKVEGGRDWSMRMVNAMEWIKTPYIMYFQEDYWINAPVDTPRVLQYLGLMEEHRLNYIRLLSKPQPDRDFAHDARLGDISLAS
jgi:hypothetical protein